MAAIVFSFGEGGSVDLVYDLQQIARRRQSRFRSLCRLKNVNTRLNYNVEKKSVSIVKTQLE